MIQGTAEYEQYYTKILANYVVKVSCAIPDTYKYIPSRVSIERATGLQNSNKIPSRFNKWQRYQSRSITTWAQFTKYNKRST